MINKLAQGVLIAIAWYFGSIELFNSFQDFSSNWLWIVLALLYTCTINELFIHMIASHSDIRKINVNSITYKILVFLTAVDNSYSLTNLCVWHRNHHMYSDTEADTLNFRNFWYSSCILAPWMTFTVKKIDIPDVENYLEVQNKKYSSLFNDEWTMFAEKWRVVLTIIFWTILFFTLPIILFKIVFMSRLIMSILQGLASVIGHMKLGFIGYRNFDLDDTSYNHIWLYYLTLGFYPGFLHNNHHGIRNFDSHSIRWFEFNTTTWIIKLLKKLMS